MQGLKLFKQMHPEELEQLFDSFERIERVRGEVLCVQNQAPTHIGILRLGELSVSGGKAKPLKEIGGFAYYGSELLEVSIFLPERVCLDFIFKLQASFCSQGPQDRQCH